MNLGQLLYSQITKLPSEPSRGSYVYVGNHGQIVVMTQKARDAIKDLGPDRVYHWPS